jgi:uncharacterized protein (TIGR00369 family)
MLDAALQDKLQKSFDAQGAMALIGARVVRWSAGEVEFELPHAKHITQQHGFVHAGILGTVMDSACGFAALSTMPLDAGILTIEYKMNCLAPAKGERFSIIGRVRKAGRTICVAEADAYAIEGDTKKLVATMTATEMTIQGRADIKG